MTDYETIKNGRTFTVNDMLRLIRYVVKRIARRGTSEAESWRIFHDWDENYNK